MDFTGKVAIVTGAGGDMGRAIVKKFTDNGAKAVLMDIREEAARRSVALLGLDEEHGFVVTVDVASEDSVKAAVQKVMDKYGRIDCLVNLAGIEGPNNSRTEEYDFKMAKKVFEINVYGTFLMMQNVLPVMQAQKSGAIVNFGSVSGMFGYAGEIAYGASKAAVIHMTKNAANENGGNGVRVNAISPGWVNTEMFRRILEQYKETFENPLDNVTLGPMNRPGEPMEMANVVVFLCSDEASYVNGSNFLVDGGMTLG
ncbi:MAG: SDR family oxidoreductase [Oscillospiraceae bacterium]|nr:SDR family oxidoreductase [Oscillospiraceae bacterium]MBQ6249287.1 SDR family oxidoreductase [Oscillospiraceae bacterium]MBQ7464883.1 SDR family oxidoreductase [Oscillospiraceae bacterium]MBR0210917.1 SDR family oxidoreductase [Oscillospiraceae bacterium]